MTYPSQIPLTPQTDPRNFPVCDPNAPPGKSGHPWPKMLTRTCTQADRDEWVKKNARKDHGETWFAEAGPQVGAPIPITSTPEMVTEGLAQAAFEPIIVNDPDEERRILERLGLAVPEPPIHPQSIVVEVQAAAPPHSEPTMKKKQHRKRPTKQAETLGADPAEPTRGHLRVDKIVKRRA